MFQAIRQTFFKFRVFLFAIRTGIVGLAVVLAGWIFVIPPSPTELSLIGLPAGTPVNDPYVRAHRVAKIIATIDSDRLYTFVADRADTGQTATQIKDNIEFAADGFGGFVGRSSTTTTAAQDTGRFNAPGGAKFAPARTN